MKDRIQIKGTEQSPDIEHVYCQLIFSQGTKVIQRRKQKYFNK